MVLIFNNQFILNKIEEEKSKKKSKIIEELKIISPTLNDDTLLELYKKSISIHQSKIQANGNFLENDILSNVLSINNISYAQQVTIDDKGIIIGLNKKKGRCYHIIDFVIGNDILSGKSITNYGVISCKTTCRERWTQDDWTYSFPPKFYLLLTISSDYPTMNRFRESPTRKIITCLPKQKDDRLFKLNFENLIEEIKKFVFV